MLPRTPAAGPAACLLFALLGAPAELAGQDEREPGWYEQAELTLVLTEGNTQSSAFGLNNRLERLFPSSRLTFDAGGLRIESGATERTAVGTADDFVLDEDTETETTAENYFAALRFDRELSEVGYVYGSGGWVRNRFAGVDNRWTGAAGVGYHVVDTERTSWTVDVGATLTSEEPIVGETDSFGGLRLTWDLGHQLTETTRFTSVLVVDENLSETEDLRASFDNAVAVDISDVLALKTGLKLLFDNLPSLEEVDLVATPGGPVTGTVLVPLDEVDTQLTVALVVTP
ncbi:MAG: DUF481 domain-containing protein [Gemmatimonadota bacterium]